MQLDIFDHGRDLMLRNDVLAALERRDLAAAQAARQDLLEEYPDDASLATLARLIEALQHGPGPAFGSHDAVQAARRWMDQDVAPDARSSFDAPTAAAWLAGIWRELAQRAAPLPFRAECGEDHAAALWLRAGDWPAVIDAVARIQSWRRSPAPLAWMAEARWRQEGLDAVWPLLAELAWLAPDRFDTLTRRLADPLVAALRRRFDAEFEPDTEEPGDATVLAWFPAWVLTDTPALAARLGQARPCGDRAPERALRLLLELLTLGRQGDLDAIVQRRKALRDTQAALYAAYLKRAC
ncbi:MAG TPA: hypothetical protein VFL86_10705 [Burkholderiaceae bacterium]|nr:hypothetical protein [Burkholderiaceae bacterium]